MNCMHSLEERQRRAMVDCPICQTNHPTISAATLERIVFMVPSSQQMAELKKALREVGVDVTKP